MRLTYLIAPLVALAVAFGGGPARADGKNFIGPVLVGAAIGGVLVTVLSKDKHKHKHAHHPHAHKGYGHKHKAAPHRHRRGHGHVGRDRHRRHVHAAYGHYRKKARRQARRENFAYRQGYRDGRRHSAWSDRRNHRVAANTRRAVERGRRPWRNDNHRHARWGQ